MLAQASNEQQVSFVGNQTGGRVFLFLYTDDFERDYAVYQSRGVKFVRGKVQEPYGTVAVFLDLYGNHWDLIELVNAPNQRQPGMASRSVPCLSGTQLVSR